MSLKTPELANIVKTPSPDYLVGHAGLLPLLARLSTQSRTPHAIIFSGMAGVGKRRIARWFAANLLAHGSKDPQSSELTISGTHPDLQLVGLEEDRKDITVEQVRQLITALTFKPYAGQCAVAIIDNAHRMSAGASNALLKTLEEPIGHSYLLLLTHAAHRLPATILSRCQLIHVGELTPEEQRRIISTLVSPNVFDNIALNQLLEFSPGGLGALELHSFFDPRSLRVGDQDALDSYLLELGNRVQKIEQKLAALVRSGEGVSESGIASALSLASELSADTKSDQHSSALLWGTVRSYLRRRLRNTLVNSDPTRLRATAHSLENALVAEKLVLERNANASLQLSPLFLDLC